MKKIMLFEQFLNEGERNRFSLLNTGEKIDTSNPMSNDLVSGWEGSGKEEDKMTYLLVKTYKYKNPIVIAGSGKPEGYGVDTEGEKSNIALLDDINRTTKFTRDKWGDDGKVIAIAHGAEEIKKFPKGKYTFMVMK